MTTGINKVPPPKDTGGTELKQGDKVKTFRGRIYEVAWSSHLGEWVFKDVKPVNEVLESYFKIS